MQSFRFQTDISVKTFLQNINKVFDKQIEQSKIIKSHAEAFKNSVIVCGDFNATPYSLPYKILKKRFSDSFAASGRVFGKTFSLFNYPMRLDYFLFDDTIKVQDHQNFTLGASDHEPILVNFKIK